MNASRWASATRDRPIPIRQVPGSARAVPAATNPAATTHHPPTTITCAATGAPWKSANTVPAARSDPARAKGRRNRVDTGSAVAASTRKQQPAANRTIVIAGPGMPITPAGITTRP